MSKLDRILLLVVVALWPLVLAAATADYAMHSLVGYGITPFICGFSVNGVINVSAYGAKCDGVTDDTAAIQAASNAAFPNHQTLLIPASCVVRQLNWTNYQNGEVHVTGNMPSGGGWTPGGGNSMLRCSETTFNDKVCIDMTDTQRWSIRNLTIGTVGDDSPSTCVSTTNCAPRVALLFSETHFSGGVNSQVADLDGVTIENRAGGDYGLYDYGGELLHATHFYFSGGGLTNNAAAAVFSVWNTAGITSPFRGTLAAHPVSMTGTVLKEGIIDDGPNAWGVILDAGDSTVGDWSLDGGYANSSGPGFIHLTTGTGGSGNFEAITVNNIRHEPQGNTPGQFMLFSGGNSIHNLVLLGDIYAPTAVPPKAPLEFDSANGPVIDGGMIHFRPADGQNLFATPFMQCNAATVGTIVLNEDATGGVPTVVSGCPNTIEMYEGITAVSFFGRPQATLSSNAVFAANTQPTSTTGEIFVNAAGGVVLTPGFTCAHVGANAHVVGVIMDQVTQVLPVITARTATTITFTGVATHTYDYAAMSCG